MFNSNRGGRITFISKTTGVVLAMASGMFLSTLAAQAQTTWYVDVANCPGPGSGSEGDPFCLIQDGIDAAVDGDEVVVADGTYTGDGNRDLDFGGQDIHLRSESLDPELCIIDCEGGEGDPHRGVFFHHGETFEAEVHGFTFTGGNETNGGGVYCTGGSSPTISDCIFSGNSVSSNGGGMYCTSGSSPTVTDCNFNGNSAARGGGMYCTSGSSPTISNCIFTENSVNGTASQGTGEGGAIYAFLSNPKIDNCLFTRNTAAGSASNDTGSGGAIYSRDGDSPLIEDCTFIDNQALGGSFFNGSGYGGGLYIRSASNAVVRNCTFVGNAAIVGTASNTAGGGAILVFNSVTELTNCKFIGNKAIGGSPPLFGTGFGGGFTMAALGSSRLTNCIFAGNSATGEGYANGGGGGFAAIDLTQLINCAIIGNSADSNGGGVWIGSYTNNPITIAELTDCTLSGNSAGGSGGGIFSTTDFGGPVTTFVDNSIVWANTPNQIVDELGFDSVTTVTYSDVQGGWTGAGEFNIDADPLFVDGPSGTWTADGVYAPDEGQTTLTDADATWGKNTLVGMFINPNTLRNLQSLIVANTATSVTVWADFSESGTIGADYEIRDYQLMDGSPCIDAAANAAVPEGIETDLPGNPRFVEDPDTEDCPQAPGTCGECPVVDMGAYEYQDGETECCGGCPTDANGDGETGPFDLATLLAAWGPVEPGNCLDADGDGEIGPFDLATLLAAWGLCP